MRTTPLVAGIAILLAVGIARGPDADHGTAATAAVTRDLEVSADGTQWGGHLEAPLFGTAVRWVPGDTRHASFWVRARGGAPVTVVVAAVPAEGRLATARDVRLRARAGSGPWTADAEHARLTLTGGDAALDGTGQRVEVLASVEPLSGNVAMEQPVDLAFEVSLLRADAAGARHEPPRLVALRLLVTGGGAAVVFVVVFLLRRRRGARDG